MWVPRNWQDVAALIGQAEETASLEFKAQLTSNSREIAKDIAALTVNGGVILYGVSEAPGKVIADGLPKVPLNGTPERLQQIAGSAITPPVRIDVVMIPEQAGDVEGVVAVVVRPSPSAPHQVNEKYPVRRGTTTANLDEGEVARLYERRRLLARPATKPAALLAAAELLPGVTHDRRGPVQLGYGRLRVAVAPANPSAAHPDAPWLADALKRATEAAGGGLADRLAGEAVPQLPPALAEWRASGTDGWVAGDASPTQEASLGRPVYSAALQYPLSLIFEVRVPVNVIAGGRVIYASAREGEVAAELLAALCIAGELLAGVDDVGLATCVVETAGFKDALSSSATADRPDAEIQGLARAPDGLVESTVAAPLALRDTPEEVARLLLDRWLVGFYTGPELFAALLN